MVFSLVDICIVGLGFVCLGVWAFFYFKGLPHASLFEPLDEKIS